MKNALLRLSQAICVASTRHAGQGKGEVDITQLVDGNKGVHVMMPKAIFAFRTRVAAALLFRRVGKGYYSS